MRLILDLSEKEFLTGISPSIHLQDRGLFATMRNTTVVRDMLVGNDEVGLLQPSPAPTTVASLSDTPFAYARNITGSTDQVYYLGTSGHLYEHDLSAGTVSDKRSGTPITNPANGLAIFQPRGGTKYLYYWQKTQIGRWDISGTYPTGWTDNWATSLQDTSWHPTHRFFDRIFYGNLNYIGYIGDDGASGVEHSKTALDLPVAYRVNCLSDDSMHLVAGLSENTSTSSSQFSGSKIIFWDTNSSSWNREWDIPESAILSIKRRGSVMYALCPGSVWAFTFSSPPQLVFGPLSLSVGAPSYNFPTQHAAAILGDAFLWSAFVDGTAGNISTFGKLTPQCPNAFLTPFGNLGTAQPLLIAPDIESNLIYAGGSDKLYSVSYAGGGTGEAGSDTLAETIFIDLKRWWQIGRAVIDFEGRLTETMQVRLSLKPDSETSALTFGTFTAASGSTPRAKEFYNTLEARKVQLKLEWLVGSPGIRRIRLYGDPIENPTHSRA
jgi:hypothetical protein